MHTTAQFNTIWLASVLPISSYWPAEPISATLFVAVFGRSATLTIISGAVNWSTAPLRRRWNLTAHTLAASATV